MSTQLSVDASLSSPDPSRGPQGITPLSARFIRDATASLAILDRELRYVATSQKWIDEFGGGRTDLTGLRHYDVVLDVTDSWREVHRRALAGESLSEEEELFVRADGRRMWLRWVCHPWRLENGDIGGILISSEDVTERVAARQALAESDARYRRLVDLLPDAVFIQCEDRIRYANAASVAFFGAASVTELVGRSIWDVFDPSVRDVARQRIAAMRRGEPVPQRHLVCSRLPDGTVARELEVSAIPTIFDGRPGIQVVVRDVTEERRTERARIESEARLSAIVHSAMDAVVTLDDAMRIVLVNEATETLFGYTAAELLGQHVEVLVPPALRQRHEDLVATFVARAAAPMRMGARAIRGLHKDGTEIPLEASIARTRVGARDEYTVVHRDLRKQLAADRARDESDERFRQLTEAIREVFWMTEVTVDRLLYVSPAYATIFGRSVAERYAHPRSWLDAVHPEDRPRVLEALPSQALGHYDLEYRVEHPDGTVRWIHDRAFPVRADDGTVLRIAGVAEDITGRRTLEDGLRQAQRMESLGRLAGGIAHDFNNLLTVAITAAELVREEPAVSDDGRELLGSMLEVGRRGTSLTRQLLAFSREEIVEPRVMELGEVVADTQKLLVRVIGEDVRVRTRIDPDHTPVRIDPGQWSQVLLNLAINARDAMPGGGELDIATGCAQLDAGEAAQGSLSPGTYAFLRVRDTGSGMSDEVRSRIFDPFFTTKPRGKGTGLGLAVVYGVVHQANGAIDVTSTVGVGTTFTIYVPLTHEVAVSEKGGPSAVTASGHERVLVVEDDDALRRIVSHVLERGGYRVVQTGSAPEALAMLDRDPGSVDLLLTDVVMPDVVVTQPDEVGAAAREVLVPPLARGDVAELAIHDRDARDRITDEARRERRERTEARPRFDRRTRVTHRGPRSHSSALLQQTSSHSRGRRRGARSDPSAFRGLSRSIATYCARHRARASSRRRETVCVVTWQSAARRTAPAPRSVGASVAIDLTRPRR